MAAISLYLDKRYERADLKFPLKIKVSVANAKSFLINTNILIARQQWDKGRVVRHPEALVYNDYLANRMAQVNRALMALELSGELGQMTLSELKRRVEAAGAVPEGAANEGAFISFFRQFVASKRNDNTRGSYQQALDKVLYFSQGAPLSFEAVNFAWLCRFREFMDEQGLRVNSQAVMFRNLRAVYNHAINEERTPLSNYPFRKFKIRRENTRKRSLTVEQLRILRDYPCEEHQRIYRDLFMLIFYLSGINMVDLCALREVRDGYIEFARSKTGQACRVKVEPEAQQIIDRYRGVRFLLNVGDRYADYKDFVHRMNQNLQQIGQVQIVKDKVGKMRKKLKIGILPELTTYWARHTVATMAVELNIHEKIIGKMLGHADSSVNGIYEQLYQRQADEAMRQILDFVK